MAEAPSEQRAIDRTSPPLKLPRFALTPRSWPPLAKPVPLNAVILNGGCVVTQNIPRGARVEICARIPSANVFQAVVRADGAFLTDGYSPATSNLQFHTVWQGNARRLQAEVDSEAPSNHRFRVMKVKE